MKVGAISSQQTEYRSQRRSEASQPIPANEIPFSRSPPEAPHHPGKRNTVLSRSSSASKTPPGSSPPQPSATPLLHAPPDKQAPASRGPPQQRAMSSPTPLINTPLPRLLPSSTNARTTTPNGTKPAEDAHTTPPRRTGPPKSPGRSGLGKQSAAGGAGHTSSPCEDVFPGRFGRATSAGPAYAMICLNSPFTVSRSASRGFPG